MKKFFTFIFYLTLFAATLVVFYSAYDYQYAENEARAADRRLEEELSADPDAMPTMVLPTTGKPAEPIEMIEIKEQTVYRGGPIAYVDYSVDNFGKCVVVWYPDKRHKHCANVSDWQTMFHRRVDAGTKMTDAILRWDDIYAPANWR